MTWCRRGDLVSQGREERNGIVATFVRPERRLKSACSAFPNPHAALENKLEAAHSRARRSTHAFRGARAADRDLRGSAGYQQFAGRAAAGVPGDAGERDPALRGEIRRSATVMKADLFAPWLWLGRRPPLSILCWQRGPFVPPVGGRSRPPAADEEVVHTPRSGRQQFPVRLRPTSVGARSHSTCRCSRMASWSASSPSTARRCARSPTSRSRWSRISLTRPSSPSRTLACSRSCASARRSPRRWSSRRRPPRCCR